MPRRKLYIEQRMVDRTIATREKLIQKIREFSDHLKTEDITLTQEILHDFLQENYPAIQKLLIIETRKNLKKLKISGGLVSRSMEDEARRIASGFEKHYKWILDAQADAHISFDQVTIEKGIPVLTDKEKKEIEEQFTCYLEEEDQELYAKLDAFAKSYNQLFGYLGKKDLGLQTHLIIALTKNSHVMVEPGVYELRNDIFFMSGEAIEAEGDTQAKLQINPKYFKR